MMKFVAMFINLQLSELVCSIMSTMILLLLFIASSIREKTFDHLHIMLMLPRVIKIVGLLAGVNGVFARFSKLYH